MRVEMTEVYRDWINALADRVARARIRVRVDRLVHGNPGQHRVLMDVSASSRSTSVLGTLIVLLAGGDKSSQQKDIKMAIELAKNL
jgi:putative component of toxin-antitoxin plasmid stabilization module